uniref:Stromelysin-2-like n=1 Tax=Callorhinchus milii TaxID=7868 RepID=A0A4W3H7D3_CALMI
MRLLKPPALLVLLSAVLCLTFPQVIAREQFTGKEWSRCRDYLQKFYNLSTSEHSSSRSGVLKLKIREMQNFFGLQVTGRLNQQTLDMMGQPRCGYPDVNEYSFFPGRPSWPSNTISYRILKYTPDLRREEVDQVISMAFQVWSDVTPLRFVRQTSGQADIMIIFAAGYHGDNAPFDGSGRTLAHAYGPGRGIGGDAHFDEDEQWTLSRYGINLFLVAAHEFGHSLGLGHSNVRSALMFPTYQYVETNGFKLSYDDIQGIQTLYGAQTNGGSRTTRPTKPPSPTKPPRNTKPNRPTKTPDKCDPNLSFDAITSLRGELWFFTNGGFQMLPGFPRNILSFGFPRSVSQIDAALYIKEEKKALFFVGEQYWSYDVTANRMDPDYPKSIEDDFPGISNDVDSAFEMDGYFYFSNGATQFKYNNKNKMVTQVFKTNSWLNCK